MPPFIFVSGGFYSSVMSTEHQPIYALYQ